jgi:hypothetical protein
MRIFNELQNIIEVWDMLAVGLMAMLNKQTVERHALWYAGRKRYNDISTKL